MFQLEPSTSSACRTAIYALRDPRTDVVCYVGKSDKPGKRLRDHCKTPNSGGIRRWISGLIAEGLLPVLEIIEWCVSGKWQEREKFWISEYRLKNSALLNVLDGGNGPSPEQFTATVRSKMSAAIKARFNTQEVRAAMSSRAKKQWSNPVAREALLAQRRTPKARAAAAARSKVQMNAPEVREANVAQAKAYWNNPEARAAVGARVKAYFSAPEAKAIQSARTKAQMSTPAARMASSVRGKAYFNTPGARAAQAARAKAQFGTPKARATQSARAKKQLGAPEARVRSAAVAKRTNARRRLEKLLPDADPLLIEQASAQVERAEAAVAALCAVKPLTPCPR